MIIGKKVIRRHVIDSTSDEARRLIEAGAGEGLVVTAARQTRGRGKPGSSWLSPAGNLYLSAVIRPYKNPRQLGPVTLIAALAARAMISRIARLPVVIKWPNDLIVNGRKIGGVLTERLASGQVIIGVGININSPERVLSELRGRATSLAIETGKKYSLSACETALIGALDERYAAFLRDHGR